MKQFKSLDSVKREHSLITKALNKALDYIRSPVKRGCGDILRPAALIAELSVVAKLQVRAFALKMSLLGGAVTGSTEPVPWSMVQRDCSDLVRKVLDAKRNLEYLLQITAEQEVAKRKIKPPEFVPQLLALADASFTRQYWTYALNHKSLRVSEGYSLFYRIDMYGVSKVVLDESTAAGNKDLPINRLVVYTGDLSVWVYMTYPTNMTIQPTRKPQVKMPEPDYYLSHSEVDSLVAPKIGMKVYGHSATSIYRMLPLPELTKRAPQYKPMKIVTWGS